MTDTELFRTAWRKSSYSSSEGGNCVEVAGLRRHVAVRDSKNPAGPHLTFTREVWQAFTHAIHSGDHDL